LYHEKKSQSLKELLRSLKGGNLKMSEAMASGIHRRELYKLRDEGVLEVIGRGLYRLTSMPEPSLPDFIFVSKKNSIF